MQTDLTITHDARSQVVWTERLIDLPTFSTSWSSYKKIGSTVWLKAIVKTHRLILDHPAHDEANDSDVWISFYSLCDHDGRRTQCRNSSIEALGEASESSNPFHLNACDAAIHLLAAISFSGLRSLLFDLVVICFKTSWSSKWGIHNQIKRTLSRRTWTNFRQFAHQRRSTEG